MKRNILLQLCIGIIILSGLFACNNEENLDSNKCFTDLKIKNIEIEIGGIKSFDALHISDTHICLADESDGDRKIALSTSRSKSFPKAEYYLKESIKYVCNNNLLLLHTGDLIDFVSNANINYINSFLKNNIDFASVGNHEFSQYVGEAKEDNAYKMQSWDKIQSVYPNNIDFSSKIINNVNFVSLDNVYYNVTLEQFQKMKEEVAKGIPIVLLCHIPFYTPQLCMSQLEDSKGKAAYLCGLPLEISSRLETNPNLSEADSWKNKSVQMKADDITLEFVEWLKSQSSVKAILCGHIHKYYAERFSLSAIQYCVGANYDGCAYKIRFK